MFSQLAKNKTARHLSDWKGKPFAHRILLAILLCCQEFCQHVIWYRFEVMECAESPYRPFFPCWNRGLKSLTQLSSKNIIAIFKTIGWIEILHISPTHCVDRLYWIIIQHVPQDIEPTHIHRWCASIHRLLYSTIQN